MDEIARMVEAAKGCIAIMPGGGVSVTNIATIAETTGATEFHSSARSAYRSPVRFRKEGVAMGEIRDREYKRFEVREESVRALVHALERLTAERVTARVG